MELNCEEIYLVKRNVSGNGLWANNRSDYWCCEIICFNQGHPIVFLVFNVLDFLIMITGKPTETNSQSFWEYGHYWVILPFHYCLLFFSLFFFFRSRLRYKGKFISSYVLCFYKSRHHIYVVLHIPSFFNKPFPHFVKEKSSTWKF